jgi:uncharacterized membrane protein
MASSKTRAKNRPAGTRAARTTGAVPATPTSTARQASAVPPRAAKPEPAAPAPVADEAPATTAVRNSPPLWLELTSFALAIIGLAISAYETYAHFNGSKLLGCSAKPGSTFDCTAVITSSQSMVFGVIPVAVLGLAFYVFALVIFSPLAWRLERLNIPLPGRTWSITRRDVSLVRLGSMIVGMGFVIYLIYAELVQIGQACEYCSGVHLVTFLLFCITVFSVAWWGLGPRRGQAPRA